jgi:hypothetical protein
MLDVVQKVNGNIVVVASFGDDAKAGAKAAYFDRCKLLYADAETPSGVVALLDDNLDVVEGCKEFIEK